MEVKPCLSSGSLQFTANAGEESKSPTTDSHTSAKQLFYVTKTEVKVWDFCSRTFGGTALSPSIEVDDFSRYIWVDIGLFCSGASSH